MWPCLCSRRLVVSPVVSNSSHWLTVASLLLAGDVQPNPGPAPQWKNSCGICSRAVRSNQNVICCDVCYEWLHTKCIGMPNSEYQRLSASDEGWRCNRCHRAFPFHDCSAISDSSTNVGFAIQKTFISPTIPNITFRSTRQVLIPERAFFFSKSPLSR